LITQD